jgi:hypothetical protein
MMTVTADGAARGSFAFPHSPERKLGLLFGVTNETRKKPYDGY